MSALTSIFNSISSKRLRQIERFRRFPHEVQHQTLRKLLDRAKDTLYGQQHGFGGIRGPEDFAMRVPLVEYVELKPYIDRMCSGNDNVLWPTPIRLFARSSGTTQHRSKLIPVSREGLQHCHFRGVRDNLVLYCHRYPHSRLFNGKALTLGGSQAIDLEHMQGLFVGDLSAVMLKSQPWWTDLFRAPSQQAAMLPHWEEKLDQIAQQTVRSNITSLSGVPSWNLVLMEHILQRTGRQHIHEVWPNLELFMHGGVSFGPYRERYRELLPSENMHYQESYNASEGFFAIQDDPLCDDMLLMLDYDVYFEFIPLRSMAGSQLQGVQAIGLDQVELGQQYAVVISTSSGLWRYVIGDTITFTSLSPYRIKITGRTRQFINVFGEELIMDNAEYAMQHTCWHCNARVREYTVAPLFMSASTQKGGHQWLVEFERTPSCLEGFARMLDQQLCQANSDYAAKRAHDVTMKQLELVSLAPGTFMEWMRRRGKLGGQNKVPRLSNTREHAEQLLDISQQLGQPPTTPQ